MTLTSKSSNNFTKLCSLLLNYRIYKKGIGISIRIPFFVCGLKLLNLHMDKVIN